MSETPAEQNAQAIEEAAMKMACAKAVAEAMHEVMKEQQPEIVRRARAKLVAQGLPVPDEETP